MLTMDNFRYLAEWLHAKVRPDYDGSEIQKYVEGSHKPLKGVIAALWEMFDRHICDGREKPLRTVDGELYAYNGRWFEKVSEKSFLKELVRRVLEKLGANATYRLNAAPIIAKECLDRLTNTDDCKFVPDRRYIAFENGVFDVREGRLKEFGLRYCTDIVLDFEYNDRASCLLWDIKLKEIIPDKDFRDVFQQFCGSLLAKREEIKVEYLAYLFGSGSNGKSVLAASVGNMLGMRYVSTFTPQQLFREGNSSMFNMNELKGKILNICDDLTASDFSGGLLKRFISGEKFKARGAYAKDFTMIQPPLMLVCTNSFPDAVDDSWGHHRRQLVILTTNHQWDDTDRDPKLTAKLSTTEARQRIFMWAYEGYKKLMRAKGNIVMPDSVKQVQQRRMEDSNPMRRWASEMGFTKAVPIGNDDPRWAKLTDLYEGYRAWSAGNGYRYEDDSRKVSAMLRSMGVEVRNLNGRGTFACVGRLGVDTDGAGMMISPLGQCDNPINGERR